MNILTVTFDQMNVSFLSMVSAW